MPNPGSQPANKLVIRFVTTMLIFASHRLRNRTGWLNSKPRLSSPSVLRVKIHYLDRFYYLYRFYYSVE